MPHVHVSRRSSASTDNSAGVELSDDRHHLFTNSNTNSETNSAPSRRSSRYTAGSQTSLKDNTYNYSRWTLLFDDPAIERDFANYIYGDGGAVGAKIFAVIALLVWVMAGAFFHQESYEPHYNASHQTSSPVWITGHVSLGVNLVAGILLFVPQLAQYREYIFLAIVVTHWPGFVSVAMVDYTPRERVSRIAMSITCMHYCCLVAQPRFVFIACFLTTVVIGTLLITTFATTGYWDEHSNFEIIPWFWPLLAVMNLPPFERRSRDAFVDVRRAQAAANLVSLQTTEMRTAVAALFPATPTVAVLAASAAAAQVDNDTTPSGTSDDRNADDANPASAAYSVPEDAAADAPCPNPAAAAPGNPWQSLSLAVPDVAVVQTDVKNFTLWASSVSIDAMVEHVGRMFGALDGLAADFGVEKIHTVGDSFVGAVFPPVHHVAPAGVARLLPPDASPEQRAALAAEASLGVRVLAAIQFGIAANDVAPSGTSMRVGVHCGSVRVAFVGAHPPKCDLFDDETRVLATVAQLEAGCEAGCVHASQRAVAAVGEVASLADATPSALGGVMFSALAPSSPADKGVDPAVDGVKQHAAHVFAAEDVVMEHTVTVAQLLKRLHATVRSAVPKQLVRGNSMLDHHLSVRSLGRSGRAKSRVGFVEGERAVVFVEEDRNSLGRAQDQPRELGAASDDDSAADEEQDPFKFSIVTLQFADEDTEQQFVQWVRALPLLRTTQLVVTLQGCLILLLEATLLPCSTSLDKLHLLLSFVVIAVVMYVLERRVVRIPHYLALALVAYVTTGASAFLMLTVDCVPDGPQHDGYREYPANIAIMWWLLQGPLAVSLLVDRPFLMRLGIATLVSLLMWALVAIRREIVEGAVTAYSFMPLVAVCVFPMCGFFAELQLRNGFKARRSTKALLSSSRGALAEAVTQAALPRFVSRAIVRETAAARRREAEQQREIEAAASPDGDEAGGEDDDDGSTALLTQARQTVLRQLLWHFDFAVSVAFVTVDAPESTRAADEALAVATVENFARQFSGLQKIKSMGRRLLFLAGVDPRGRTEPPPHSRTVAALCELVTFCLQLRAALQRDDAATRDNTNDNADRTDRGATASNTTARPDGVTVTAGVHAGPVYGAVLGHTRAAFDVFGDAVNTASRMQTTAATGTVQVSWDAATLAMGSSESDTWAKHFDALGFGLRRIDDVQVKGKGVLRRCLANLHTVAPPDAACSSDDGESVEMSAM